MRVIPHLEFDGTCEEAFRQYETCFHGKIAFLLHYGENDTPLPLPELAGKVFHATLELGGQSVTGVDVAHARYAAPQGFSIQLNIEERAEAKRLFAALSADALIHVPLQRTSWSGHYAAFADRFGIPWEINCVA